MISLEESGDDAEHTPWAMSTKNIRGWGLKRKSASTSMYDRAFSTEKPARSNNLQDDMRTAFQTWVEKTRYKMDQMSGRSGSHNHIPVDENFGQDPHNIQRCMQLLFEDCPDVPRSLQISAMKFF